MDFRLRDRKVSIRVRPVSSVLCGKAFGRIDHAGSAMSAGVSTSINVIIIVIVILNYIL